MYEDSSKVKSIQEMHKNVAIRKSDKGNGIVLTDAKYHTNSVKHLLKDLKKFKILDTNPTITQAKVINKITKAGFHLMRTKNAKPVRAHGIPKIYKEFLNISKFRPINDTKKFIPCLVGQYLANLLYLFTTNQFSLKDSLDAANRIKVITSYLFENGYLAVKQTADIILLRQVYLDHVTLTNLEKKDFVKSYLRHKYQNCLEFYQQKDGVSLGSPFGPVLANIIMTELGDVIVKPLIAIGTIKFYNCFVDDTLLVMKPENISEVYNAFNKFDKNLGSTLNMSQNEVPYFLDLELSPGITFFFLERH